MARGTVRKMGDMWAIRYSAGVDPVTGKRRQPSKRGFATRAEAEAALAVALAEVATGRHIVPTRTTFADAVQHWLDAAEVRGTTYERYEAEARRYFLPALGHRRLQELNATHMRAALRAWSRAGLSATYVRALYGRLSHILSMAVQDRHIAYSPLDGVKMPKASDEEIQVWSVAELAAFLPTVPALGTHGPLWQVYAMTGLRRGEALGLRWKDIDFSAPALHIHQQAIIEHGAIQLRACKTPRSVRTITIDAATVTLLRVQRAQVLAAMLKAVTWTDNDLVFPAKDGTAKNPDVITRAWKDLVDTLPQPHIRLHDLRHTHATHLLSAGTPAHIVAARLGHTPAMLLKTYSHILSQDHERVVTFLESAYSAVK